MVQGYAMGILGELLSSRIRAEIFRNLFGIAPDTTLYMREIERRTGFAIGTVQTELKKLQRLDIIRRVRDGNRVYYSANTAHPLYPDIRALVLKTSGLADVINSALGNEKDIRLAFVFLYHDPHLSYESSKRVTWGLFLMGVSGKIGREINPHVFSKKEFIKRKTGRDHFLNQVLDSPKIFIIGTENELAEMA
jgi:DNA-binding transcriptional ArsR family regulator